MAEYRKSWLIGIKDGFHPLGTDGTIPCLYLRSDKVRELAQSFQKMHGHDEVWELKDSQWTQKVCEMNLDEFVEHVRMVGKRIL